MAGVQIKMRAHTGQNHQKTVQLVGQHTTIFGTSNWSTASDDNQLEVNYFTTKDWFHQFFADQFEWKWNNLPPDGSSAVQTTDFVPLPPDAPTYQAPANLTSAVSPDSVTLSWYAGDWARKYDLYLGVGSNPELYSADMNLGPSQSTSDYKSITVTGLLPGTTYSWKVVSKTMANVAAEGPLYSFTTSGVPPENPAPRHLTRHRHRSSYTRPRRAPPYRARREFPEALPTTSPSPVFNSSLTALGWGRKTGAPPIRCCGIRRWEPVARIP